MPLISCPDCSSQVSSRAVACPKCGCPIAGTQQVKKTETPKKERHIWECSRCGGISTLSWLGGFLIPGLFRCKKSSCSLHMNPKCYICMNETEPKFHIGFMGPKCPKCGGKSMYS